jgi:hypothetical protein
MPVVSGVVAIGNTLTATTGSWANNVYNYSYQWTRNGVSINAATSSQYTVVSDDIGFPITCRISANSVTSSATSLSYSLGQISGLYYVYNNRLAQTSSFSTLADQSLNNRTLTSAVTASAWPSGYDRDWAQNGEPVIGFDEARSQYLQDQAGDAITYANQINKAGTAFITRFQVLNSVAERQIFGTWDVATSNQNATSLTFNNSKITWYVTSKTGGGTTHIAATVATNDVKYGDVVTVIGQHKSDKTWNMEVIVEPRSGSGTRTTILTSGSYASVINTGSGDRGLTLGAPGTVAANFGSFNLHTLAIFSMSANTANDIVNAKAYLANKCNFSFVGFNSNDGLIQGSDFTDGTHWNNG